MSVITRLLKRDAPLEVETAVRVTLAALEGLARLLVGVLEGVAAQADDRRDVLGVAAQVGAILLVGLVEPAGACAYAALLTGAYVPADGERVTLWVQNSQPCAIPAGSIGLNLMGDTAVKTIERQIAGQRSAL